MEGRALIFIEGSHLAFHGRRSSGKHWEQKLCGRRIFGDVFRDADGWEFVEVFGPALCGRNDGFSKCFQICLLAMATGGGGVSQLAESYKGLSVQWARPQMGFEIRFGQHMILLRKPSEPLYRRVLFEAIHVCPVGFREVKREITILVHTPS